LKFSKAKISQFRAIPQTDYKSAEKSNENDGVAQRRAMEKKEVRAVDDKEREMYFFHPLMVKAKSAIQ
jgi:hypothetical protein